MREDFKITPKETAEELIDRYYQLFPLENQVITTDGELSWEYNSWEKAIKASLICVDEIRDNISNISAIQQYWIEVKKELEEMMEPRPNEALTKAAKTYKEKVNKEMEEMK